MTMEYECGSFKRNSSVAPFSLFISFFFLFFLFFCIFVASLALSIYLSFVLFNLFMCPLLGSFILSFLGSFPHLRATLYILQEYKEDLSHFTRSTQHKEN